jgi:FAD/FMN-containing dehydrogenase
VVTGTGSILTASSTENPDLYFGIRGGGCNFGVVTEFVLKLHEHRRTVYSGAIIFPGHLLEKVHDVTLKHYLNHTDPKAGLIQVLSTTPDKAMVSTTDSSFPS